MADPSSRGGQDSGIKDIHLWRHIFNVFSLFSVHTIFGLFYGGVYLAFLKIGF